jgi:5-oxoprolinase (ATP-hydrolysing)
VTDANVMVGKLVPDLFPAIFGPNQDEPLDVAAVRAGFTELAERIGDGRSPEAVADGFIQIAVANMAEAVKKISIARGYDVTRYALNAFGGASGQHACRVADALGMTKVLIHPYSGLLSAYGMGLADIRSIRQVSIEAPFDTPVLAAIAGAAETLGAEARGEVEAQGIGPAQIVTHVRAHIRYAGTDTALEVPAFAAPGGTAIGAAAAAMSLGAMRRVFEAAHKARFGFIDETKAIVVEAVSVEAVGGGTRASEAERPLTDAPAPSRRCARRSSRTAHGTMRRSTVARPSNPARPCGARPRDRAEPDRGDRGGLARVAHRQGPSGARPRGGAAEAHRHRHRGRSGDAGDLQQSLHVHRRADGRDAPEHGLFREHQGAARFLLRGVRLDRRARRQRAAHAGAPGLHGPLGGEHHPQQPGDPPRRRVRDQRALQRRHASPDITVCTPVFDDRAERVLFWVASRGHHADVGGTAPGSMSPDARTIEEEGVYIDNFKLVDQGRFCERELVALLTGATYPVRNVVQNVNDLKAQIAANEKGVAELRKVVDQFGLDVVQAYMGHVQDNAAESVRRVLERLGDAEFTYPMDQGCAIRVRISVDRERREATVDFTGTSEQRADNFNAPEPVTRAAVLYVFRVMVEDNIPMNAGCLRPINIVVPKGSMLSPEWPAAVVAGNVEVSQAVTNCLFGRSALGAAQGTMNNLTFGNERYQYYETICSGAPAGEGSAARRAFTPT